MSYQEVKDIAQDKVWGSVWDATYISTEWVVRKSVRNTLWDPISNPVRDSYSVIICRDNP